jgi:hypothetical protein
VRVILQLEAQGKIRVYDLFPEDADEPTLATASTEGAREPSGI